MKTQQQKRAIQIARDNPLINRPNLVHMIAQAEGLTYGQAESLIDANPVAEAIQR